MSNAELLQQQQLTDEEAAEIEKRARYWARADPFLVVCKCFSVITVISALLCVAVNVYSAVESFKNGQDIFAGILRCYAVLIALFVVIAETEWERILKFWLVLEYWTGRGMLQIFVAVMTRALTDAEAEKEIFKLLEEIASYMLLGCGVIYFIAGILCCGSLKRSRLIKATSREQAHKDLEELEKRREELRKLLMENRN